MCGQCYAYNRYATLPDSNSLSMGFSGYQNVNSSSQRDNFFHSSACIQFYLHKLEKKIKAFHGRFRERLFVCLKSSDYENQRLNCVKKKDKVCGNG